jgi:hypothetical protein
MEQFPDQQDPIDRSKSWSVDSLYDHFTTRQRDIEAAVVARFADLQSQIDRRIHTQERERGDTEKHLTMMVDSLRRELEIISRETQRAVSEATAEREKAAQALASSMAESIKEGDERLREHIENQVNQIEAALESARRETKFAHAGSQKAIDKAEEATDKRFEAVSTFREELSGRMEKAMSREVAEAREKELAKRLDKVEGDMDKRVGEDIALQRQKTSSQNWTLWIAGAVLTMVIVVVNIVITFL